MTTPRYCAPEVAAWEPKNSSADIWSLGCVFLEMWTVLCGETIASLDKHMTSAGSGSPNFCHNIDGIVLWCNKMCSKILSGSEEEQCLEHPRTWILSMLKPKSKDRCDAQTLFDLIQETNANPCVPFTFTGLCCIEDEYSDGSVLSSIFEHDIIKTTHKSDTITPPHVPDLERSENPPALQIEPITTPEALEQETYERKGKSLGQNVAKSLRFGIDIGNAKSTMGVASVSGGSEGRRETNVAGVNDGVAAEALSELENFGAVLVSWLRQLPC